MNKNTGTLIIAFGMIPLTISQIVPLSSNNIWMLIIISALIINYGVFRINKTGGVLLLVCLSIYAISILLKLSNLAQ